MVHRSLSLRGRLHWLRAAVVLPVLAAVAALALILPCAALVGLSASYPWIASLIPWQGVLLPVYALAGAVLIVFMAALSKPLLRLRSGPTEAMQLEFRNEPDLFDFIAHVAEIGGVPCPRILRVDMSPGLHAQGGVLVLGMPAVAALSTAELAGMVARALALDTAPGRAVAGFLYRLYRMVHGRDRVDDFVERASHAANPIVVRAARVCASLLGVSHRWWKLLLDDAVKAGAGAMRDRERQGDRALARVIGAARFGNALQRMRLLGFTCARSESALRDAFRTGVPLPHQLPLALVARMHAHQRLPGLSKVIETAEREQERIPAFHAADSERVARMSEERFEPAISCATPVRGLMRGFALISRRLSLLHYRHRLNIRAMPQHLHAPTDEGWSALDEACGHAWHDEFFLTPARFLDRSRTTAELAADMRRLAEVIPVAGAKAKKLLARKRDVRSLLVQSLLEELQLRAGGWAWWVHRRIEAVQMRCRSLEEALATAITGLDAQGELVSRWLACGIALLERPETGARLAGARALAAQAMTLADALERLQQKMDVLHELGIQSDVLELALARDQRGRTWREYIAEQQREVANGLLALRVALKHLQHPLQANTSVLEQVQADWVPTTTAYELLDEAQVVREGLLRFRGTLALRLVAMAKMAEAAWSGSAGGLASA